MLGNGAFTALSDSYKCKYRRFICYKKPKKFLKNDGKQLLIQFTVPVSIYKIDNKANYHPNDETNPIHYP